MCGIVGHITTGSPPDLEGVKNSLQAMRHRGPDAEDFQSFPTAVLGHRRLSIIDTEGSPQPFQSDNGRYTLVFNGEIYNYIEIREQLQKEGVVFRTKGDTEVLLRSFELYGKGCLELFNGMFAFAIWDERDKILFAARDRMGEKPFYFAYNSNGFVFASELQVFQYFQEHVQFSLDHEGVHSYFSNQFISGTQTIYREIKQLPPAHFLEMHDGDLQVKRYWTVPVPRESYRSIQGLAEELKDLLTESVRIRLRSDVPLGIFLSGGLDSAAIAALMKNEVASVESFTISFEHETFDESPQAQISADILGTNHHQGKIAPDFIDDIPGMLKVIGQPFADTSVLPTWYLCQYTRKGVTVALSGDGADELFGGYKRYLASRFLDNTHWLPYSVLNRLIEMWPDDTKYYGKSWSKKIRLLLQLRERRRLSPLDPTPHVFLPFERMALFNSDFQHELYRDDISSLGISDLSPTEQMLYVDAFRYLPDDILVKVDRMSMAHSLEVRAPFLDHTVVEFCSKLPLRFKVGWFHQKILLREMLGTLLPPSILNRPKHGFAAPVGNLLKEGMKSYFEDIVFGSGKIDFMNPMEVKRLWGEHIDGKRDHGFKLWTIFMFYCWYFQVRPH